MVEVNPHRVDPEQHGHGQRRVFGGDAGRSSPFRAEDVSALRRGPLAAERGELVEAEKDDPPHAHRLHTAGPTPKEPRRTRPEQNRHEHNAATTTKFGNRPRGDRDLIIIS
jgi:hypothetical protein